MTYIDLFWRPEQFPHHLRIVRPTENPSNDILGWRFVIFSIFARMDTFRGTYKKSCILQQKKVWETPMSTLADQRSRYVRENCTLGLQTLGFFSAKIEKRGYPGVCLKTSLETFRFSIKITEKSVFLMIKIGHIRNRLDFFVFLISFWTIRNRHFDEKFFKFFLFNLFWNWKKGVFDYFPGRVSSKLKFSYISFQWLVGKS